MERAAIGFPVAWAFAGAFLLAQEPAFLRKDIPIGLQPSGVIVGDFTGDGRSDLTVKTAAGLLVLPNAGNGDFHTPILVSSDVRASAAADFNDDGKLDLVGLELISPAPGVPPQFYPQVLLGQGDGTFLPLASGDDKFRIGPSCVGPSGDFNGDGRPDLLIHTCPPWDREISIGLAVLLNDGDGQFFSSGWYFERVNLGGPLVADFNRDGLSDLSIHDESTFLVFLGQGNGDFHAPISTPLDHTNIVVADFNNDGLPDLASHLAIFLGEGDGSFQAPLSYSLPEAGAMPISYYPAAAADFDADGHVDLVVDSGGLSASSQLLILPGKGDGTLLPAVQYGTGRRDSSPPSTVSDVDGDGRPDVITANRWSSTLSLLLSRAEGGPLLRRAVSAASGTAIVAPDSLATLFGSALAAATERADPPWPASLGGIRLEVTDSAGATRLAPLLYVSPTQINFQVPSGTASGEAEISILGAVGSSPGGTMLVNPVAPGLFLSPTPFGPPHPAAVAILVESDGSQTVAPLCYPLQADCFPSEIPQSDGQVLADQRSIYVALFGTGFRNAASVTCSFHGAPVPVEYAGPQAMPGVDQINVRLPPGTRVGGTGVVFTVDGAVSNAVWP